MKKKRTYDRRRNAVRWGARLAVVVLFLSVTGVYDILPSRSVRKMMQREGLSDVEIIHSEWGSYDPMKGHLLQIGENEEVLTLTAATFHPLIGWYATGTAKVLNPEDPEQRYGTWDATRRDEREEWVSLFGFVPDGETAPTFRLGVCDWYVQANGGWGYTDDYFEVTPVPTIPVKGGKCYLEQYGFDLEGYGEDLDAVVTVCDENGNWILPANRYGTHFG